MKVLITGACGFVGSRLAEWLVKYRSGWDLWGIDNLSRPGAETNRARLRNWGVRFLHADLRNPEDLRPLPAVDWVIDAAALPSVLTGAAVGSSLGLMENNLFATVHLLEFCRARKSGLVLLSTSRVYSAAVLSALPISWQQGACTPRFDEISLAGLSPAGVAENFSQAPPLSLYGASKMASETLALEYAAAYSFPLWINRCGVMAGAGQLGHPGQGVFSYWVHAHRGRQPLRYCGFDGQGGQVRDLLHPWDLARLVVAQLECGTDSVRPVVANVAGGMAGAISLRQLTDWCDHRFGPHLVTADPTPRPYDVPWLVLDSRVAQAAWNWQPEWTTNAILEEITLFSEQHPQWLELTH